VIYGLWFMIYDPSTARSINDLGFDQSIINPLLRSHCQCFKRPFSRRRGEWSTTPSSPPTT